ncbi:sulfite exporter TauE/SafE family protein [Undibacterium flavidum]|uniref:Sulfite exporter TauE/SafE family protein n=1 Tax=Undibacterium flavidum TaxID=2762297 RepID=A0ABR6YEI7_9BURK|nr:sulfite exporter TauE/SafE family protein [Undibacterium flavidum]MBC3874938.1 sulfite exporter TauE/SafE family protein [Undibacterium flavidum]
MLTLPLILAALSAGLIGGVHCIGMCGGIASILSRLPRSILSSQTLSAKSTKVIAIVPDASYQVQQAVQGKQDSPYSQNANQVPSQLAKDRAKNLLYLCYLHGGRLSTYMLIGAIFGGFGAASLRWKADFPVSTGLFVIGNLALILLGLRLLGVRMFSVFPSSLTEKIQHAYGLLMPSLQKGSSHPYLMGMTWGALPCGLSYAIAPFALLSGAAWSGAVLMLLFGVAALPHLLLAQTISHRLNRQGRMRGIQILFAVMLLVLGGMGLFYFDMKNMPDILCITPQY